MEETPQTPQKEENTITKTPPPRVKNPQRVAQGKRLALISKAAKQKKREEREQQQQSSEKTSDPLITTALPILGACCTLLLTYIAYSQWMKETPKEDKTAQKKSKTFYKDLSQYDL